MKLQSDLVGANQELNLEMVLNFLGNLSECRRAGGYCCPGQGPPKGGRRLVSCQERKIQPKKIKKEKENFEIKSKWKLELELI